MPGCAAIGCNNRSEKGYTMKCFPRDPILRQIWKDRVGRADWEPSNNSFLCHAHFAPNQWMVTQCGRLKLRKGAVPSIFRVVSTRKSPNKRRRLGVLGKSEDEEYGIEIIDDDDENYIYLEAPDLGRLENIGEESIVFLDSQNSPIVSNIQGKDGMNNVYQIISNSSINNLQNENVLVISDESSTGIGTFVHNSNKYIIINNENEDINNQVQPIEILTNHYPHNSRIKIEVKDEGHATADEIYDEVESNMERIYEGINSDNESSNEKSSKLNKKLEQIEVLQKKDSTLNGKKIMAENDISDLLKGSKSSDSIDNDDIMEDEISVKQSEEISNLKAALQRKRKAREETMKSIERFISDSVEELSDKDDNCSEFTVTNSNKRLKNGKFEKQFSEDIEDVSDIMRVLGEKSSVECSLEENADYEDGSVTSVTRLENNIHKRIKTEKDSNYDSEGDLSDQLANPSTKFALKKENVEMLVSDPEVIEDFQNKNQSQEHFSEDQSQYNDHNFEDHEEQESQTDLGDKDVQKSRMKRNRNSDSEGKLDSSDVHYLRSKVEKQKSTIVKLTDHISTYKDVENKLQEVSDELKLKNREILILSAKLNRKENNEERNDRNFAAMHSLIKDLTQKVKTIEDVNRQLSRSISVEHQNKKNLEYQVRSREKTIKELNWKVEKASKLLERADRNANNYKRRVNNMKSLLKRKNLHLSNDKQSSFDVLFGDYVKNEFSEESLQMAAKIQRLCGNDGYEVLLSYNFPLPSQRTLRRRMQKYYATKYGTNNSPNALDTSNFELSDFNSSNLNDSNLKNNKSESNELDTPESNETVTGTVQDIFNENNDMEEINEKEFKEHLFKFMNV